MKKMRNTLLALGALAASLMTAACSDVNNASAQTQNSAKSGITVSGSLSSGTGRSATSSLASDTITWKVAAATKGETGGPNYASAIFGSVSEDMTFTITLPEAGDYYFIATGYVTAEQETQVLQGKTDIINVTAEGRSNIEITAKPSSSEKSGKISLPISDESGKIENILIYEDGDDSPCFEKSFLSGEVIFAHENPTAGVHIYQFCFDDANGNTLYTCREAVTVFSSLTTDSWIGNAPYFVQNEDGTARFVITEEVLEKYGAEAVPDTPMMLYNVQFDEYNDVDGYKYYLADSASQAITDDTPATVTTSSSKNSFCFDGDGYYYVIAGKGESATYIKSNKPDFGSETLENTNVPGAMYLYGDLGGLLTVDRLTNKLYMFDGTNREISQITKDDGEYVYKEENSVYFPAKTFRFAEEDSNRGKIDWETVFTVYNGVAYFASVSEGVNLVIAKLENAVAGGTEGSYNITGSKLVSLELGEMNLSSDAKITDMLYQDGAVYMLLNDSRTGNSESEVYSRGAVIKYDTVFETVTTGGWTEGKVTKDVKTGATAGQYGYQLYESYSDVDDLSTGVPFVYDFAGSNGGGMDYSFYAPYDDVGSVFSGPQKFVAIKPKKLVVADSGVAFYTDDEGVLKYKNVNRVVYVDLESLSITGAADVSDVNFCSSYPVPGNTNFYSSATEIETASLYRWTTSDGGKFTNQHSSSYVQLYAGFIKGE